MSAFICCFQSGGAAGQTLKPKAMSGLLAKWGKRGIETHLGHKMVAFEADKVCTEGGEFKADLILFMPGMTAMRGLITRLCRALAGGLLQADAHCKVEGMSCVYVAGDWVVPRPDWMPKQAHIADLQAVAAAKNLWAELNGQPPIRALRLS